MSTASTFAEGNYDGILTLWQLLELGTLGLGTVDRTDGELIVVDGKAYQVPVSGKANLVDLCMTTPFAAITHFSEEVPTIKTGSASFQDFQKILKLSMENPLLAYSFRI